MTEEGRVVGEVGDARVVSLVGRVGKPRATAGLEVSGQDPRRDLMKQGQWHPSGQRPSATVSFAGGALEPPASHLTMVPARGVRNSGGLED
jgi:hypothetical protein